MLIALNENGERIYIDDAVRHVKYYCQKCHSEVVARKGVKRSHHYSHCKNSKRDNCDSLSHDKSVWHRSWQNLFPVDYQEILIKVAGSCHIADILIDDLVIEFQHSPMSIEEFNKRNNFYTSMGKKVIWIFDVRNAIIDYRFVEHIFLKKEIMAINGFNAADENVMVFLQIRGKDFASMEDKTSEIRRITDKDEMGFIMDKPLNTKELISFINGDISYEDIIQEKEQEEMLSKGTVLRRLVAQSRAEFITAKNAITKVEARIQNNDEVLNAPEIIGQVKTPGHDTFTKKIYSIYGQNDPVWVLT